MGVYIKNLKMPDSCFACRRMGILELVNCKVYPENIDEPVCPLVEIKAPHGRLIDADKAIEQLVDIEWYEHLPGDFKRDFWWKIDETPTVIDKEE